MSAAEVVPIRPGVAQPGTPQDRDEADEFFDWLQVGVERKWVSGIFCNTHDGGPMRDWEEREFEEGYDPCIHHVRVLLGVPEEDPWATTAP